jgi:hypothetical protein
MVWSTEGCIERMRGKKGAIIHTHTLTHTHTHTHTTCTINRLRSNRLTEHTHREFNFKNPIDHSPFHRIFLQRHALTKLRYIQYKAYHTVHRTVHRPEKHALRESSSSKGDFDGVGGKIWPCAHVSV